MNSDERAVHWVGFGRSVGRMHAELGKITGNQLELSLKPPDMFNHLCMQAGNRSLRRGLFFYYCLNPLHSAILRSSDAPPPPLPSFNRDHSPAKDHNAKYVKAIVTS